MPTHLDRIRARQCLEAFDLRTLFIEELGWDRGGVDTKATVAGRTYVLEAIAHKRGLVAYRYVADSDDTFPDYPTRRKIEKSVAKTVREHIIVYAYRNHGTHHWQWVKREPGRPDRLRQHIYHRGQPGEALIQKLELIVFTLDEEEDLTIMDVSGRVRAAFDVEKVTRKFYERFKKEHRAFLEFIEGIKKVADREWYASLMLNRMMFIYFIQKRGFLDGDTDYLRNRLEAMRTKHGKDRFQSFYRLFLLRLFHEGLGQPVADRSPELAELLGRVPYLNGGLFDVHDLEQDNPEIQIPDAAFEQIFGFFDAYQWHLDDRPLHDDKEINPDVLGYIFEKYINQKQMGAYYTKENITGYISRNIVIPFLFERAKKHCPIAFTPGGGVWRLLSDDPDRYFYEAVRHGITYDIRTDKSLTAVRELPPEIAAGLNDVSQRGGWNKVAPKEYALPTETWREHVARRQRYRKVRAKLAVGEVTSINDLITYNLDIEKFVQDVIAESEGPELVRAFWKELDTVSILDPTCGSGAFLFAALNILEPIYSACLEAMQGLLDDLKRSKRKHRPEKMSDFRKVLDQVHEHASERYFILKSIMVSNLYGVDIMEEAVEICKLRLFLKLVAQLERYEQIEPLPDIDFNVRAGNTLVGFTTLKQIQNAVVATPGGQQRMLYAEDRAKLKQIEEDAKIADRAFRRFREMQTEHGMDAGAFAGAKLELRKRLDDLRAELDRYLAGEYGVKTDDQESYEQWRGSHQPFHWFVEFYGTMRGGGFDAIIGNPPYVTYPSKKVTYSLEGMDYRTLSTKNLYGLIFERSTSLARSVSPIGLIVQLTSLSSEKLASLQGMLLNRGLLHAQSFPRRPQSIFEGVEMPVSILLSTAAPERCLFTTNVHRFYSKEKPFFIDRVSYCDHSIVIDGHRVAKFGDGIDKSIYQKIGSFSTFLGGLAAKSGEGTLYYQEACRYWVKAASKQPFFKKNGEKAAPSHWRSIQMISTEATAFATCILNSSLFYWYYSVFSDCEHINDGLVRMFPIPEGWNGSGHDWKGLCTILMDSLGTNAKRKLISTKQGHVIEYKEIFGASSKLQIDLVDKLLAEVYGLSNEELDFIVNYDLKYRMGREARRSDV